MSYDEDDDGLPEREDTDYGALAEGYRDRIRAAYIEVYKGLMDELDVAMDLIYPPETEDDHLNWESLIEAKKGIQRNIEMATTRLVLNIKTSLENLADEGYVGIRESYVDKVIQDVVNAHALGERLIEGGCNLGIGVFFTLDEAAKAFMQKQEETH